MKQRRFYIALMMLVMVLVCAAIAGCGEKQNDTQLPENSTTPSISETEPAETENVEDETVAVGETTGAEETTKPTTAQEEMPVDEAENTEEIPFDELLLAIS